jgi:hypothetical protein
MKKQGKGTVYEEMKWQEWKRSGQGKEYGLQYTVVENVVDQKIRKQKSLWNIFDKSGNEGRN